MPIVLARIDNRLIHGQVLEAWVPYVRADHILVIDDVVANDPFRRKLMESVVPSSLKLTISSHAQIPAVCDNYEMKQANLLVLFADPASALQAYHQGCIFKALNLGNMHVGDNKCCISKTLYMDSEDLHDLEQMAQLGIDISAQCIPSDRVVHWDCECGTIR